MQKTLKQKTISAMIWNGLERFGSSLFLFISNLVLARLLLPEDFGAIGMLMVFISLSQAIIDGGFGAALIQKKEPTQKDYSTIFFWNIALSIVLYVALYISSPAIARFYDMPSLSELLRVLGIVIVFNSLFLIQNNILKKSINFKKVAKINLLGIVIGTIIGIIAAYCGYGVWSLVIKTISTAIIQCVSFWVTSKWRPQLIFCWSSFKSLFAFGGYMFLNTIVVSIYQNTLSLIIGKLFTPSTLGYFSQARKLEDIPRTTISSVINNVAFPVFSELQNDLSVLKSTMQKFIKFAAFLSVPLMVLLSIIAKPLIILLFSEKWASSIPLFQILCFYGAFYFLFEINSIMIRSIGKSKLFFQIRMIQTIIGITLVLIGSIWGINYVVLGYTLSGVVSYAVIANKSGELIDYGLLKQLKDIAPIFTTTLISGAVMYGVNCFCSDLSNLLTIFAQASIFATIYISLSILLGIFDKSVFKAVLNRSL